MILLFAIALPSSQAIADPKSDPDARIHIVASDFVLSSKLNKIAEWGDQANVAVTFNYLEQEAPEDWSAIDLVIIDAPLRGNAVHLVEQVIGRLEAAAVPWMSMESGGRPALSGGMEPETFTALNAYYEAGGEQNFRSLLAFVSVKAQGGDLDSVAAPVPMPSTGIYHPDAQQFFENMEAYEDWGRQRWPQDAPRFAVIISSTYISAVQTRVLDAIVERAEAAGVMPVLFWFDGADDDGITSMVGGAELDLIANFTHMQNGAQRKSELEMLDVPAILLMGTRSNTPDEWREAQQGIEPSMAAVLMATPEAWGMGDPIVVSGIKNGEPVPIPEQIELLIGKVQTTADLRRRHVGDRKLSMFFWNVPQGERNMSASNLNVPASVEQITAALQKAGYRVPKLAEAEILETGQAMLGGYYHPDRLDRLLDEGLAVTIPVETYSTWLNSLPAEISRSVIAKWGAPASHWAVRTIRGEHVFVIPAVEYGNLLFLPQPPRADAVGEAYHDVGVPPGHLFLATYLMVRDEFDANAIIHLGTHGTQEWTPGKDRGLWSYDFPILTLGNVPVFYPYIQDNVSEAMQAKRRGRAVTISHQTPPFAPSGFYDELRDVHSLLHERELLEEGAVRDETDSRLIDAVIRANMHHDLQWAEETVRDDFAEFLPVLHDHMHDLAQTATPLGLHTFGVPASADQRLMTIMQQLGAPFYDLLGADKEEMFAVETEELVESEPHQFLVKYLRDGEDPSDLSPALQEQIEVARSNERHLADTQEVEALLHALDGGFTKAGSGGDPIRNPKTSSGRNLFAFEPDKIPTQSAYKAGEDAFEGLVEAYRTDHDGRLPDKLAFSLFSSDAIRTLGITEAQIMHALGVRPVWGRGGRIARLEIISAAELGRPRVDVVIQATSVYRDQFDGLMRMYAEAIDQLSGMDEAGNAIFVGSSRTRDSLLAAGVDGETADRLASIRIFSNAPGDYGSGVPDAALDSTNWEDDAVIANTYLESQSFAFGVSDWGMPVATLELFEKQLQGVDAAILARSSNVHGVLSTDHPFEYLGGLSAAVRAVNGKSPTLYVSDLRRSEPRMVQANKFLSDELRVRYQNPQWISSMMDEGYAGTVEMLKVTNNLFGWQVSDDSMVRDDQWQAMHDTYVMDARALGLNEWFETHNPTAQAQIIERMSEAIRKGYWQASDQTQRELARRWLELTEQAGADSGEPTTTDFLERMATGFGLDVPEPGSAAPASDSAPTSVQGQVMNEVASTAPARPDWMRLSAFAMLVSLVLAGAGLQLRSTRKLAT
ncbi:MAG: cobaltochelatase subunit CobN [Pseudomonadota bacterium]|nr:cobaltochelatase subunit CobN [Pseudomonadota bacterium]